ncbi:hypothetical protein AVEN_142315-1 [Araneus ventricosus]|uniref:Secreted protein n=1 Tax=Araneus ventricosus TaxID=182803 RepID=A0A4Y2R7P0_ARAVE|nr:hypothetical protein AVEN_142315-1 [Araneus ventricosus]
MMQTFVFDFLPLFFVNWIALHISVSESASWSLYSVTSLSRKNASDLSSAGIFLFNSSKTAKNCFIGIMSRRFEIARLGYGERFMQNHCQWKPSEQV